MDGTKHGVRSTTAPEAVARIEKVQALVVSIINDLLCATEGELDFRVNASLRSLGQLCGCDRAYLFQIHDIVYLSNTHEWCADGIAPMIANLQDMPVSLGDNWWRAFRRKGHVHVADVTEMPPEDELRETLESQSIRTVLAVPVRRGDSTAGFLGLDSVRETRDFSRDEIDLIASVANVIGTVLHRRDSEVLIAKAHADLAAERARLSAMVTALPDLVLETDADGTFIGYHQKSPMIMAVDPSEIVGKTPEQVLPPHVAALARHMMATADVKGHAGPREYTLKLNDEDRWFSAFVATRLPEQESQPRGYVIVVRDITQEMRQRRQVERLGAIARQTSSLVILTDMERRITWINAACEVRTGHALDQAIGKTPFEVLGLQDAWPGQIDRVRAQLQRGQPVTTEVHAIDPADRSWWARMDTRPLASEIDGTAGYMYMLTDITDRKRLELAQTRAVDEARAARERLENAVNALPDAFVYYDRNRRLVLCNETYRRLYPKSAHRLVPGARLVDLLEFGDSNGELVQPLRGRAPEQHDILQRFDTAQFENEVALSDGRWLRILERATSDGGRVALLIDITALKNAETRALRDRAAVMDASREGIAFVAPDGVLTYANPALLQLFEIDDAARIIGKHWSDVYPLVYPQEVSSTVLERARPALQAQGFWQGEITDIGADGKLRVHALSITQDENGTLLCLLRDKSRQRRAQVEQARLREALHRTQRRAVIARIASETAHDFSNLLAAISGSLALIERDTLSDTRDCQRIHDAIAQGRQLLDRLTSLGKRSTSIIRLDFVQAVIEAVELVRPSLPNGDSLHLDLPQRALDVEADATDVLQVVLNLVINARDAVAESDRAFDGTAISVRLRRAGPDDLRDVADIDPSIRDKGFLRLDITDTGIGISDQILQQAFNPYFTTKGDSGSGLGLAIVNSIVTAIGGHVRLERMPRIGTRATVLWPCQPVRGVSAIATEDAGIVTDEVDARRFPPLKGLNVLVVDDDDGILAEICTLLERAGAEVAGCISAEDALQAVAEDPGAWDAIITDFNMPGLSGFDLAQALHTRSHRLAILLYSALVGSDTIRQIPSGLFDALLHKPAAPDTLVRTLSDVMQRRRPKRADNAHTPGR